MNQTPGCNCRPPGLRAKAMRLVLQRQQPEKEERVKEYNKVYYLLHVERKEREIVIYIIQEGTKHIGVLYYVEAQSNGIEFHRRNFPSEFFSIRF